MKYSFYLVSCLLFANSVFAKNLRDYSPYKYEVLFTNPICDAHKYPTPVNANNGQRLFSKPANVYCKVTDMYPSMNRSDIPLTRLVEWIKDSSTKEVFMAYLTFSNKKVTETLCDGLAKRNLKLTVVLDAANDNEESGPEAMAMVNKLKTCGGDFKFVTRGGEGGLVYAHNKVLMINPSDEKVSKIVFSSGNMTSGTVIHHENWHFITTSSESNFAGMHRCLKDGMVDHGHSKAEYINFVKTCRSQLKSPEEDDIKVFFIPGDGAKAYGYLDKGFNSAKSIDVAAHRFSNTKIMNNMMKATSMNKNVRLIADDDIYWTGVLNEPIGRNAPNETVNVNKVEKTGVKVKYMETNQEAQFLHHNKFLVFNFSNGKGAVYTGAGNLTNNAFTNNFENFYYISIPEVYTSFVKQYEHMWTKLATDVEHMPSEYVNP